MATQASTEKNLPIQTTTAMALTMTVLNGATNRPIKVPPEGTLHAKASQGSPVIVQLKSGFAVSATELDDTGCWVKVTAETHTGWCHLSGLIPTLGRHLPWLEVAQREIGVGEADKPGLKRISDYMNSLSDPPALGKNWCACFINWCMKRAGAKALNTPRARRWTKWESKRTGAGTGSVPLDACLGDLAVGKLEAPEKGEPGHVAILLAYCKADDPWKDQLLLLGGNQSANPLDGVDDKKTSVRYSWYPRATQSPYPVSKLMSVNFQP